MDIVFAGKPDLEQLRATTLPSGVAVPFVRVRWTVADEDRHVVDRAAVGCRWRVRKRSKLEGRIVPLAEVRAEGISQLGRLADKIRADRGFEGKAENADSFEYLEMLAAHAPEQIVDSLLRLGTDANPVFA